MFSKTFYPNLPTFLHGYILHIRDILQLCVHGRILSCDADCNEHISIGHFVFLFGPKPVGKYCVRDVNMPGNSIMSASWPYYILPSPMQQHIYTLQSIENVLTYYPHYVWKIGAFWTLWKLHSSFKWVKRFFKWKVEHFKLVTEVQLLGKIWNTEETSGEF